LDFAVKMNEGAKACGVQVIEGFVDLRGHRTYFAVDAAYEQQVCDRKVAKHLKVSGGSP
jgi:hypothetical protein